MGAWGVGAFENDDAMDWVWGLDGDNADEVVAEAVRTAERTRPGSYLEVTEGANAIAAATLVASAADGDADDLPPEAIEYLKRAESPDEELVASAIAALDRVTGEESEAAELWDESDDGPEWRESIARLRARLQLHT